MSDETGSPFEKVGPLKKVQSPLENVIDKAENVIAPDNTPPDKALFDSAMKNSKVKTPDIVDNPSQDVKIARNKRPSFIDEVTKLNKREDLIAQNSGSRLRDVRSKTKTSLDAVSNVRKKLADPNITVKKSFTQPLQNKLSSINDHLSVLNRTAGTKPTIPEIPQAEKSALDKLPKPIKKFVGLLVKGQSKLEELDQHLMYLSGEDLSPAQMLAIQIKMGHISHELELFASLLNKAIESTKTIMNTQV